MPSSSPGSRLLAACALCFSLPSSANLIVNGDFEAGNTGFTSDYTHSPLDITPAGVYAVTPDPSGQHPSATSYGDHTSGSGLMLAVNGSTTTGDVVWEQTVAVTAGATYDFAAYLSSWVSGSPANLSFVVNGSTIGSLVAPLATGVWELAFATWNAGAASSATIRITNGTVAFGGNDFALDDLFFGDPVFSSPEGVTEPGTLLLLAAAGAPLLLLRRRREGC